MHITKIELEDIKSHIHFEREFQRGTTAISGENGAGKTTIIEAIAWTLFDLLDYKKEDFVRRGAKKGIVRVNFQSSLDEREYSIYRDTGSGYYVYDLQLKTRIAEKKEEVARFLWQHLGVEAGTDLESLFRRAIGVPQGTFTAIFLETPAERKKAFDKLLKVEEYRQGAEKLLETARFVENKIVAVSNRIAHAEGKLSRFELVESEHKTYASQALELRINLEKLNREVAEKKETVKKFDETETAVIELKAARDRIEAENRNAEFVQKQKETEKNLASAAAEKIKLVENDYKIYVSAVAALKNLETERNERDKIRAELNRAENRIVSLKAEQKSCDDNLKKIAEARENIIKIQPEVRKQEELEMRRETLRQDLANARAAENQVNGYEKNLKRLRDELSEINNKIKEAEQKSFGGADFDSLQKRDTEITGELAKLHAVLERDEQFERDVLESLKKHHFCPILSQKCLNLETGKAQEAVMGVRNGNGKARISVLETEQKTISTKLTQAREAEKSAAVLPAFMEQRSKITEDGKRLREEQEKLRRQTENLSKINNELAETESELRALDNPKAKLLAFETEIRRESELKGKLAQTAENLVRAESEKTNIAEQLSRFETLDMEWKRFSDERDKTAPAHSEFLANEALAKSLPQRERELETADREVFRLKHELETAVTNFETANKNYDREKHLAEKATLLEAEKRQAETRTTLDLTERRAAQLAEEL